QAAAHRAGHPIGVTHRLTAKDRSGDHGPMSRSSGRIDAGKVGGARVDARPKVTGEARYAADIAIDNVAYAALVTSAIAKGRIAKLGLDAARDVPGVLDILSYRDAKVLKRLKSILDADESAIKPLATSKIWHDGQIIALVVADSFEAAREGAY